MRYDNKHVLMRFGGGGNKAEPKGVYMTVTSDVPCLKVPNKENTNKFAKSVKKSFTPKNVKQNIKEQMNSKTPKMQVASVSVSTSAALKMIDTFDRPGDSEANKTFSRSDKYAWCEDKHGRRIPKAGAFAEAGVGEAKAEYSIFEAAARGPNAGASAEASVLGVKAMATAGIGTASAQAGPIGVKVGLALDTGVGLGVDGFEAKFLGIGFSVGPKTSISLLGNEVSCCIQ
ncbi:uncharacterized protein LOC5514999 isoform X2 [Nematostella vectensis]|nr:uncharacterized protein LOC5514999 isoform X2 [Nematostella vectensis]XP_032240492.2 uncharacterized protein LOC5514999 isoform X2 [Nematostella vectensis]